MFHVKHEGWTPDRLSADQLVLLDRFEGLLRSRAVPRGLVASSDVRHLRERHVLDSLRGVRHVPDAARRACDLGSGAGLPGIPLAIALPDLDVTLAEGRQSRAAFLELAVERLELGNVRVHPRRAQELPRGYDLCLARGFASAAESWAVASGVLDPSGTLLYWAGASFDERDLPAGARARAVADAPLESGGPIVIMTRQ